jgi:Ca-activated chloride channel homolog
MRRLISLVALLLLLTISLGQAITASAEGIIVPPEPRFPAPVLKDEKVTVRIADQVALTRVDQVFVNNGEMETEGTYIFPLPAGAVISDFTMMVDGKVLEGKILEKADARSRYEEIVRQRRDPALLEYMGDNLFQAIIFPIPPHAERRIYIEYSQVLKADQGLVSYLFPLHGAAQGNEDGSLTISVNLESAQALQSVYSPLDGVVVNRDGDKKAEVSYEGKVGSTGDFSLYYTFSDKELGLSLLTYKTGSEDGYFLMLVSPPASTTDDKILARDLVLVLDTSGSMEGDKIAQAREAAKFVLNRLNPGDRFNIVSFSEAGGGTNIDKALLTAADELSSSGDRLTTVIFLTDGLPTVGEEDVSAILDDVKSAAPEALRLFAFGVGYDVNTLLLDQLAQDHHGAADYVLPEESIEDKVSRFYGKIGRPMLTDVDIDFGSADVYDVYPTPLPDLFEGSQLVLTGRYRGSGTMDVTVKGRTAAEQKAYSFEGQTLTDFSTSNVFIPQLWAGRKIGYLLSEIKLHGDNEELIQELTSLSLRYGIVTPYTSYFVEEQNGPVPMDGAPLPVPQDLKSRLQENTGAAAVQGSKAVNDLTTSASVPASTSAAVKQVRDKTFILHQDVWTDSAYRHNSSVKTIKAYSAEYFDLISQHPDWATYLSAGENMIVVLDGTAYQVVKDGAGQISTPVADLTPEPDSAPQSGSSLPAVVIAAAGCVLVGGAGAFVRLRHR